MAAISLEGVRSAAHDGRRAIDGLDLDVTEGELMALLGVSGAGKTTLLRLIAGLAPLGGGTISIDGEDMRGVATADRDIAMTIQGGEGLAPHLSTGGNLGFALRLRKMLRREVDRRVSDEARVLGLSEVLDRLPSTLSGGEAGATALGRAMVRAPRVFLLDEPFARIDAAERARLRTELVRRIAQRGITTLLVTNDPVEAMAVGDRLAVLHEGRIAQVGPPTDVYRQPRSVAVAQLVGDPPLQVVPGVLEPGGRSCWVRVGCQRVPIALPTPAVRRSHEAAPVLLGVRAEHATAAVPLTRGADPAPPGLLVAELLRVVPLGAYALLRIRLPEVGTELTLRLPAAEAPSGPISPTGAQSLVGVRLDPDALLLFDPTTEQSLR